MNEPRPAALILGASRGLGLELVRQYRADGWDVIGSARNEAALAKLAALGARTLKLDVTGEDAAAALDQALSGATLGAALYCAGIYGPRTQALDAPAEAEFAAVMRTNVLGAMRLAPRAGPALARGRGKLAVLSSRMASIGSRSDPSGWLYRASKAALNSVLKDISLVLGPQGVTCVALSPGWARTDMGGAGANLDVDVSVAGMRATLAGLKPAQNGSFLHYDGSAIAW